MWLIVPWFCPFSLLHQHTPTVLLSSASSSPFPGLGPLAQLPSHLHHLPLVQGQLPTVHWAFHTGVSHDRAPLKFSKNAEVKTNELPPQCCADKAKGPFQLEGEERRLVFESEYEFPLTIISLLSRVELARCKCSINTCTRTHTFPRNPEDQGKINKANCIRSQETWIPGLAVIALNYVATGNFFSWLKINSVALKYIIFNVFSVLKFLWW